MAIFGNSQVLESVTLPEVGNILPTMEASDQIIYESAEEMYKINAALYVADIMIEQSLCEGAGNAEVLVEGVVGDFFRRIINMFKKMWAKIKEWFANVLKAIKILFMSGTEFVKKYKSELDKKNVTGYIYNAYKYDVDKMNSAIDKVVNTNSKYVATKLPDLKDATKESVENSLGDIAKMDNTEWIEDLCGKYGIGSANNVSELKQEVVSICRDGMDTKLELKDFEGNSKSEMIKFIEGFKKCIDDIAKDNKDTDKNFNNAIKAIESGERSYKGGNSDVSSAISKVASNMRSCLSISQAMYAVKKQMYEEVYRSFTSILKGYLTFKPKKEGFDETGATSGSSSILESAMKLV